MPGEELDKGVRMKILISCSEATFIMSKKEEHASSLKEKIGLMFHLMICEFCRYFLKQTRFIAKQMEHASVNEHLTDREKTDMDEMIKKRN